MSIKNFFYSISVLIFGFVTFSHAQPAVTPLPMLEKTYQIKPDYRKCAYPMCGGYFLTPVNQFAIQLQDDAQAYATSLLLPENIYVASINYKRLGLSKKEIAEVESAIRSTRSALIQGKVKRGTLSTGSSLVAQSVWVGANNLPAFGPYLTISSSGIMCITSPCPSFLASLINTSYSSKFHEVNFEKAELDREQEAKAWQEISTKGLVMTGVKYDYEGFAGPGIGIAATKVFFSFPDRR